tara:strand:- start:347 stop:529 length:183 start_codon:yes stop_codon:yes gene_type:complete
MEEAIKWFGSQEKMARALGCSHQNIQYWKKVNIPVMIAIEIEKATQGEISRAHLCPHIFN